MDVWSLGIILLELVDKGPPIPNKNNIKAMMMIMKNAAPTIKTKGWSPELLDFCKCCLTKNPK